MTETFNVNTKKHEMFCSTVILINATKWKVKSWAKKNYRRLKNVTPKTNIKTFTKEKIIHKNFEVFFNLKNTRLIQSHDCLFIEPRISWWSETQAILTCTSHWTVCNSAKLIDSHYVASHRNEMQRQSLRTFFPLARFRITAEISFLCIAVLRRQVDA